MKQNIWIVIILILVLALGIETGYLLKGQKDMNSLAAKDLYRPSVMRRGGSLLVPSSGLFQNRPFQFGNDSDRWDPFQEMENMRKVMNRMFNDSFNRGLHQGGVATLPEMSYDPDIDMKDTGKEYLIKLDLPGIDKDKINVKVDNNQLMITGERQMEKEETQSEGNFYHSERSFGSFMRSVPLSADADTEHMTAQSANGVLTVRIPKLPSTGQPIKQVDVT